MAARALLARLGLRIASAGTASVLALAVGTTTAGAARIGLYADTTGSAERLSVVVGAIDGAQFRRSGSDVLIVAQAGTRDGIALVPRGGGSNTYLASITTATLGASRTYTLPDATTVLAGLAVAQTFSAAQTMSSTLTVAGLVYAQERFQVNRSDNTAAAVRFAIDLTRGSGALTTAAAIATTGDGSNGVTSVGIAFDAAGVEVHSFSRTRLAITPTTAATSTTTGSLVNAGGFGNAGAAFFGSTVSAASTYTSTSTGAVFDAPTGTTNAKYLRITNTSGDVYVGTESNSAGGFFTGSAAYDAVVWTPNRLFLRGATGVAINGAASLSSTLDVNANATFTSLSGKFVIGNSTGSYPQIGYNITPTAGGGANYRATDATSSIYFNGSTIALRVAASGTAGNAVTWTTPLSVTTTGAAVTGLLTTTTFKANITASAYVEAAALSGLNAVLAINDAAGSFRQVAFTTGGSRRIALICDGTAESGANAGSNGAIGCYADDNSFIDFALQIMRVAGGPIILNRPLRLDNTYVAGAPGAATGTVTLQDAAGVTYRVPVLV